MSTLSQTLPPKLPDLPVSAKLAAKQSEPKVSKKEPEFDKKNDFNSVINRLINDDSKQKDVQSKASTEKPKISEENRDNAEEKPEVDKQLLEQMAAQNAALASALPQIVILVDTASMAQTGNSVATSIAASTDVLQPILPQTADVSTVITDAQTSAQNVQAASQNNFDDLVQMLSANQETQNTNLQQTVTVSSVINQQTLVQENAVNTKADAKNNMPEVIANAIEKGQASIEKLAPQTTIEQSNVERAAILAKAQNITENQMENFVNQNKKQDSSQEATNVKFVPISTATEQTAQEKTSLKPDATLASIVNTPTAPIDTLQNVKAPVILSEVDETQFINKSDLLNQVSTDAIKNAENIGKDFVMTLKPEGLGEITVKMSEQQGHLTLQLTASNSSVQKILSAELEQLREAMKPYRVEVSEVNTKTQQQFSFSQDNSAAQQEHNRQLAQQFEFARQQRESPSSYYGYGYNTNQSEDDEVLNIPIKQNIRLQAMDRYI